MQPYKNVGSSSSSSRAGSEADDTTTVQLEEMPRRPPRKAPKPRFTAAHRCVTDSCDCLRHAAQQTVCCGFKVVLFVVVPALVALALAIYALAKLGMVDTAALEQAAMERVTAMIRGGQMPGVTLSSQPPGITVYAFTTAPLDHVDSTALCGAFHGLLWLSAQAQTLTLRNFSFYCHPNRTTAYVGRLETLDAMHAVVEQYPIPLAFVVGTGGLGLFGLDSEDLGLVPSGFLAALDRGESVYVTVVEQATGLRVRSARLDLRSGP